MIVNKRELLKKAFDNEVVEKIPVGFWHHFVLGDDQFNGLENESILEKVLDGHKKYYEKTNPDMMKLMNEGFFGYPPIMENDLKNGEDLLKIKSIGENHPWINKQVEHVRKLVDMFGDEVMTFYNVFAPLQVIRIKFDFLELEYDKYPYLAENYPEELHKAGLEIQKDILILVEKLLTETNLDGIYYCVQNIQSDKYDKETYKKYIKPTEIKVLERANELSDYNILHICGYANYLNDLTFYEHYEAKVYNWATHTEKISINEGRKIFKDKCILGGFDNNPNTIIDNGTQNEIEDYVKKLIDKNGYKGYIIGADCSIPNDIDDTQVRYISDATYKLMKE